MPGFAWWVWMILAGVVGLSELHLPGSYLMWIGLGAAITGLADAALGLSLSAQIAVFLIASAASCLAGYFVYRRLDDRRRGEVVLNQRDRMMIGARGVVCEAFRNGQGKVRVGDGVWLAAGAELAEGMAVVVTSVHGTRLNVQPLRAAAGGDRDSGDAPAA